MGYDWDAGENTAMGGLFCLATWPLELVGLEGRPMENESRLKHLMIQT